jgi:hypothetical protein
LVVHLWCSNGFTGIVFVIKLFSNSCYDQAVEKV